MNDEIESLKRQIALSRNAIRVNGRPDRLLQDRLDDLLAQLKKAKTKLK